MLSKSSRDAVIWALKLLGEMEESEKESNSKPSGYPDEFEWLWGNYPERSGGKGDKRKGFQYCNALISNGETWKTLAQYMKAYEKHCNTENKIGTSFVLQFTSFFGPGERYKENWSVAPLTPKEKKGAQQSLIERANSGDLYKPTQSYYYRDGKKWDCAADYFSGKPPID